MAAALKAHVIGAGMAGLSAAVELTRAGFTADIADGAAQAGGRCRSYHDPQLGRVIDNGNHLVLSGNDAVMAYLRTIGASDRLAGPAHADFEFVDVSGLGTSIRADDLASGRPHVPSQPLSRHPREGGDPSPSASTGDHRRWASAFAGMTEQEGVGEETSLPRWTFRPNDGRIPWWMLDKSRRLPGTRVGDYLRFAGLVTGTPGQTIPERVDTAGPVWDRLLDPVLVSALNTQCNEASATLAAAIIKGSLLRGGLASRPRIAEPTLAAAFVDPAIDWLGARAGTLATGKRLRAIGFEGDRVASLDYGDGPIAVAPGEPVILAVPTWVATALIPGLSAPTEFRAIVNAHFAFAPPKGTPAMIGVIGGTAEWVFAFEDRLSVTVSAADDLVDTDREALARIFWHEITQIHKLDADLPPWQIVKEKRATFAATPAQDALRPHAKTRWRNLFLAGDWTQTGLPSTIEGAIRSGVTAARLARTAGLV